MTRYRQTMADAYGSVVENTATAMQVQNLKKAYADMKGKRISFDNAKKLQQIFNRFDSNKELLKQLYKADIPFVSSMASARLISKHAQTAQMLMQIRKEGIEICVEELRQMMDGPWPLDEASPTIAKVKDIVKNKQAIKIDGTTVDLFTASAISKVYDKVNDVNKKKMDGMKIIPLANIAMKLLKNEYEYIELDEGKMSQIDAMQKDGATAKEIAKKLKLKVSIVKGILGEEEKIKEETLVEFTSQQIKQAYGILNDPRYKQGNYSGAVKAIEKLARGLSNHPDVANALKRANESLDEEVQLDENANVIKGVNDYMKIGQEKIKNHPSFAKLFAGQKNEYKMTVGPKYIKIHEYERGQKRSIHAFVDKQTGDLYKPAGVNAPAKGARGNVTDPKFMAQLKQRFDVHGGHLYKSDPMARIFGQKEVEGGVELEEKFQDGFAVRCLDPKNGKRFVVPLKTKKDADDKAAQLKWIGMKDITITKHNLNFKEGDDLEESSEDQIIKRINAWRQMQRTKVVLVKEPGNSGQAPYEIYQRDKLITRKHSLQAAIKYLQTDMEITREEVELEEQTPDPTQYGPDKVAKAMKIAVNSDGKYTIAVREIEKIAKNLSKVSTIARALQTANEQTISERGGANTSSRQGSVSRGAKKKYRFGYRVAEKQPTGDKLAEEAKDIAVGQRISFDQLSQSLKDLWTEAADKEKGASTAKVPPVAKDNKPGVKIAKIRLKRDKMDGKESSPGQDPKAMEKQILTLTGQVNLLKAKIENEKHKAIKPVPNKETGEVPLTVGIGFKHLRDKLKKEAINPNQAIDNKDPKIKRPKKTATGEPSTEIDTEPKINYNK
jgi:hypothetical protein